MNEVVQKLIAVDCAVCGIIFGVTEGYRNRRVTDGKGFYCPNKHANVYTKDEKKEDSEEVQRLKQENVQLHHKLEQMEGKFEGSSSEENE